MKQVFDLDMPLLSFTKGEVVSHWTIREAVEGVGIFGGIGSGKTSGSGRTLARKFLQNGFGGLVLTVKPDEKSLWQDYCREANRLDDLIIVEPNGKHFFNFIEYESHNRINGTSITTNIVQILKTIIRSAEEKSGGKSDDPFWETALDMLIHHTVDLCILAYGKLSIQELYDVATTTPKVGRRQTVANNGYENFQGDAEEEDEDKIPFYKAFKRAQGNVSWLVDQFVQTLSDEEKERLYSGDREFLHERLFKEIPDARILQNVDQFFIETYRSLSDRTKSIIEYTFQAFLFKLLCEPVYSLFCNTASTFRPEASLDGKIILIHLPVKLYHHAGRDSQVLFKLCWQRAMEKRDVTKNSRPVFLWADEAQHFLHEFDAEFQATARSSRIATVYLSQNLPNYYANMGGTKAEYRVKSFLGTLGTKIFHANACIDTNNYASALIGDGFFSDTSNSSTIAENFSFSQSESWKLERIVRPEEFVGLKNGSRENNYLVEAYMHRQGRKFPDGWNFKRVTFSQK